MKTCNGPIFRAEVSQFRTKKGFSFQVRLNLMKKLSCPGCENCGGLYEALSETNDSWPILGLEECENKKLYTVDIVNISRDWESGVVDNWDLSIMEIDEDNIRRKPK